MNGYIHNITSSNTWTMWAYASGIRPWSSSPIAPYCALITWHFSLESSTKVARSERVTHTEVFSQFKIMTYMNCSSNPYPPSKTPVCLPSTKSLINQTSTALWRWVAGISASIKISLSLGVRIPRSTSLLIPRGVSIGRCDLVKEAYVNKLNTRTYRDTNSKAWRLWGV